MEPSKEKTFYFTTRFIPDSDEKGVILIDPRTKEFKSGQFEVAIYESSINSAARLVSSLHEPMSFKKYAAMREDIDPMSVDELKEYFPQLQDKKPEEKPAESEKKDEKKSAPKSDETSRKTDGESGAKETEQKSPVTDKADSKK